MIWNKMEKELKDMTNKELKQEWIAIESHIRNFAYGKWELNFRDDIEKEANKRCILL
jgi:hypothetical protein